MRIYQPDDSLPIEECQILAGIDTLYFFVDASMNEVYQNIWQKAKNQEDIEDYEPLGFSGMKTGFIGSWYRKHIPKRKIPLYRIGFKDPKKQRNINDIYIQLEGAGIYLYGIYELLEVVKSDLKDLLGVEYLLNDFVVSRADLNAFCGGYNFYMLRTGMFVTRSRKEMSIISKEEYTNGKNEFSYIQNRQLQTLYIGSKSSPIVLKIYNKLLELQSSTFDVSKTIKYIYFQKNFNQVFDNIWNIEFTIKRKALKEYSINTVEDLLKSANSLWRDLMTRNRFVGYDVEKIESYRNSKNQYKLKNHPIWDKLHFDYDFYFSNDKVQRKTKPRGEPSKEWWINLIKRNIEKMQYHGIDITKEDLHKMVS